MFDSYSPLYMNSRGRGIGGYLSFSDEVYEHVKELWDAECQKTEGTHRTLVFEQGSKKDK